MLGSAKLERCVDFLKTKQDTIKSPQSYFKFLFESLVSVFALGRYVHSVERDTDSSECFLGDENKTAFNVFHGLQILVTLLKVYSHYNLC